MQYIHGSSGTLDVPARSGAPKFVLKCGMIVYDMRSTIKRAQGSVCVTVRLSRAAGYHRQTRYAAGGGPLCIARSPVSNWPGELPTTILRRYIFDLALDWPHSSGVSPLPRTRLQFPSSGTHFPSPAISLSRRSIHVQTSFVIK